MFAILNGNHYARLPFTTAVVDEFTRNHQHRERDGLIWTEPMQLSVHLPALMISAIVPANNENEMQRHG